MSFLRMQESYRLDYEIPVSTGMTNLTFKNVFLRLPRKSRG